MSNDRTIHTLRPSQIGRALTVSLKTAVLADLTEVNEGDKPPWSVSLMGPTGSAKTTMALMFANTMRAEFLKKDVDFGFWELPVPYMQQGDFGIPFATEDVADEFHMKFPDNLPLKGNEFGMVWVDEFDRGDSLQIHNQVTRLMVERKLYGKTISPKLLFVFAGNGSSDAGTLVPTEAYATRTTFLYLDTTSNEAREEWDEWAARMGIDPAVRALDKFNRIDNDFQFEPMAKRQDRTMEAASRILKAADKCNFKTNDILPALIAGTIGMEDASKLLTIRKETEGLPDPKECNKSPDTAPRPKKKTLQFVISNAVIDHAGENRKMQEGAVKYLLRLHKEGEVAEVTAAALWKMGKRYPNSTSIPEFQQWCAGNKDILFG